ncbi:MAG: gas vesicle synthesis protein GvpO [uncultured archaeon A07HB70]|nr:MAG: gas vesicle synthesis protein GvpO [uncultured archaeon A07HB70]
MTDQPVVGTRDESGSTGADDQESIGILEMRELVAEIAGTLLDGPFDGITSVERTEDDRWRAVFEVVERSAVPDTQDIIGRYELYLSTTGEVEEYALQQRFKRSELQGETL